jgi:Subtilase family
MSNSPDAWLDFLSTRRPTRMQPGGEGTAEYIPVSWVTRDDGRRVPVVRDEIIVPNDRRSAPELRPAFDGAADVTDAEVEEAHSRLRFVDDEPAHTRTQDDPATLSYVAVVSGRIKNRPTAEATVDTPGPAAGHAPAGYPFVIVIDTGLSAPTMGLSEERSQPNRDDQWAGRFELAGDDPFHVDRLDVLQPPGLDIGAGHGTFVASVIARVTPARIVMIRAFDTDGIASDHAIARAIRRAGRLFAAESRGRGVLNLSGGVETKNGLEPEVLRSALATLPPDVVVIAAAGNDDTGVEFWPAASERALGITALGHDQRPLYWSNRAPWVNFSTLGIDVVASYVIGTETQGTGEDGDPFDDDPETFHGPNPFAQWEGTSFSAAQVSGRAANVLLADPGLSRTDVTERLERQATGPAIDGCGLPLHIL